MARKKNKSQGQPAGATDPRNSFFYADAQALADPLLLNAGSAVAKGADLLGEGASALGGLARAGFRAAGSVKLDAVSDAARDVASTAAGALAPAAEAVIDAAGTALSAAGDMAGPALEAAGEVAGQVLGAAVEAAGDVISS